MSSSLAGRAIPALLSMVCAFAIVVAACDPPVASVGHGLTLYVRNAAPQMAWFAIDPSTGLKPEAVGFGPDPGVACLDAPVGTRLVQTTRSIAQGGTVTAVLASVDHPVEVLWVDVGPDGNTVIGRGVPAWWSGDPPTC